MLLAPSGLWSAMDRSSGKSKRWLKLDTPRSMVPGVASRPRELSPKLFMDQFCEVFKQADGGVMSPGRLPSVTSTPRPFCSAPKSPPGEVFLRAENKVSPGNPKPSSMSIRLLSMGLGWTSMAAESPMGEGRGSILILGCLMGVDVSRVRESPEGGESTKAWDSLGLPRGGVTRGDSCKGPAWGPARLRELSAAGSPPLAGQRMLQLPPSSRPAFDMIMSDDTFPEAGKFCFLRPLRSWPEPAPSTLAASSRGRLGRGWPQPLLSRTTGSSWGMLTCGWPMLVLWLTGSSTGMLRCHTLTRLDRMGGRDADLTRGLLPRPPLPRQLFASTALPGPGLASGEAWTELAVSLPQPPTRCDSSGARFLSPDWMAAWTRTLFSLQAPELFVFLIFLLPPLAPCLPGLALAPAPALLFFAELVLDVAELTAADNGGSGSLGTGAAMATELIG